MSNNIPICVLCKCNLEEIDTNLFKCPTCKREYIMDYEIMTYDDSIGTAHDEEAATIEMEGIAAMSGPRLETKPDELDFKSDDDDDIIEQSSSKNFYQNGKNKTRSDIKIPDYMKDSETKKVIDYKEE